MLLSIYFLIGMMSTEPMASHNSDARYSAGSDLNVSTRSPAAHAHDRNEPTALESCSQLLDGSLNQVGLSIYPNVLLI